jgi:hypothetical protein
MRIAGSIITLVCGAAVVAGIFLPWASGSPETGWEVMTELGVSSFSYPLLLLVGGIVTILCAIPLLIVSLSSDPSARAIHSLSVGSVVGITLAMGAGLPLLIPLAKEAAAGYGLYITGIAAVVGMIFAVIMAAWPFAGAHE